MKVASQRSRPIAVVLAVLVCLTAVSARAQSADPNKARAQAGLREGNALLQQGRAADALVKFKEAYRLVPSPKIFYNIGQAESLIPGLEGDAYQAMSRFLVEAKDANPELRAAAEEQRLRLRAKVALVTVTANPADGNLLVDGGDVGKVSSDVPVVLVSGTHRLMLKKASTVSDEETLTIAGGESFNVRLEIKPIAPPPPPVVAAPSAASAAPAASANVLRVEAEPPRSEAPVARRTGGHTWRRWLGAALAVAAAASLTAGIIEHVRREDAASAFVKNGCGTSNLSVGMGCGDLDNKVIARDVGMALGYGGAALFTGAAAYVFWVTPNERAAPGTTATAAAAPAFVAGIQGRF